MRNFEMDALADGYADLVREIFDLGDTVSPRGQLTHELLDVTIQLNDPADVLLFGTEREGYRPEIGVAEALQLVGGVSDPALLSRITRTFARFQDGGVLHGAYGPRLLFQLPRTVKRLKADHDTRQAVVTIWDPMYDGAGDDTAPRDLPCTVYLSFRIRNGELTMKTHMRSNDVWLGLPYDVIQFTTLQHSVAKALDLHAGPYVHHVDSLHLYDRDVAKALNTVRRPEFYPDVVRVTGIGHHGDTWPTIRGRARQLIYPAVNQTPRTLSEMWLDGVIAPYRA